MKEGLRRFIAVDAQNIFYHGKLNYDVLKEHIESQGGYCMFNIYTSYDPDNQSQGAFISAVGRFGYRVVSRPIRQRIDGTINGDMDAVLIVDVMQAAAHFNEFILVSGDSDFVPLIQALSSMGKKTVVYGYYHNTSQELINSCHEFYDILNINNICRDT